MTAPAYSVYQLPILPGDVVFLAGVRDQLYRVGTVIPDTDDTAPAVDLHPLPTGRRVTVGGDLYIARLRLHTRASRVVTP